MNTDLRPPLPVFTTSRVSAPLKAVVLKRIRLPSGDQVTQSTPPGAGVTRRFPEPSAFMTHTPPAVSEV